MIPPPSSSESPPPPPSLPSVEMPPLPGGAFPPQEKKVLSNSPFAAMFGGVATPEEVQKFIDGCLRMIVREIKRAQDRWEKTQRRMRQMMEGKLPDE